jgi:hypothetical protein
MSSARLRACTVHGRNSASWSTTFGQPCFNLHEAQLPSSGHRSRGATIRAMKAEGVAVRGWGS